MKRILLVMMILVVASAALFAEDSDKKADNDSIGISIDGGAGISVGFLPADPNAGTVDPFANLITIFSTLRGSLYGQVRYDILDDFLSAGINVGIYAITWGSDTDSVTILDFPVHALVRVELADIIAVEGFGGYYISAVNTSSLSFSGLEVGGKANLGGFYVSGSQVFATTPYQRVEIGWELTDLFEF